MDKNNLGIIKDMAKLFQQQFCQVCSLQVV